MVTVREIRSVRSFCCIFLDDGSQYWIRNNDLYSVGFKDGAAYDRKEFLKAILKLQYPRALNHAVSMLSRRPYSKKEIYDRLLHLHYSEEASELVLYKLEKEKLLDDYDFCEQWIRFRISSNCGPSLIRKELRHKGIKDEMIDSALENIDRDEELKNAVVLARKAWKRQGTGDIRKRRQKVIAALVRKGYDWNIARSACKAAGSETDE